MQSLRTLFAFQDQFPDEAICWAYQRNFLVKAGGEAVLHARAASRIVFVVVYFLPCSVEPRHPGRRWPRRMGHDHVRFYPRRCPDYGQPQRATGLPLGIWDTVRVPALC